MITLDYTFERQLELEREEKLAEGLQQGLEQGLEQGMRKSMVHFVHNMLQCGMSDEDICALAECEQELIDEVRQNSMV